METDDFWRDYNRLVERGANVSCVGFEQVAGGGRVGVPVQRCDRAERTARFGHDGASVGRVGEIGRDRRGLDPLRLERLHAVLQFFRVARHERDRKTSAPNFSATDVEMPGP